MDRTSAAFTLRNVAEFSGLAVEELWWIAGLAGTRSYSPEAVIIPAGIAPHALFIPMVGQLLQGGVPFHGAAWSFSLLLGSRAPVLPIVAGTDGCSVLTIGRDDVLFVLREVPRVTANLLSNAVLSWLE